MIKNKYIVSNTVSLSTDELSKFTPLAGERIIIFGNTDWYIYNFWLHLAQSLKKCGAQVHLISPDGEYVKRFHELGLFHHRIKLARGNAGLRNELKSLLEIIKLYKEIDPSVVHHLNVKPVIYGSIATINLGVSGVIQSFPGLGRLFEGESIKGKFVRKVMEIVYRLILCPAHTHAVFQVSEDSDYFVKRGIVPTSKNSVIKGSGVDMNKFYSGSLSEQKTIRVLMASRICKNKGVLQYLEAANIVNTALELHKPRRVEFLLAGCIDIDEVDSISIEDINSICERSQAKYLYHVEDMPALLKTIDLLVLPTLRREGVPRILVEAAGCGLPIIATDVPGCMEVVKDGYNGIIVKKNSVIDLSNAIKKLILNKNMRIEYGLNGKNLVEHEFSADYVDKSYINIYTQLINKNYKFKEEIA